MDERVVLSAYGVLFALILAKEHDMNPSTVIDLLNETGN